MIRLACSCSRKVRTSARIFSFGARIELRLEFLHDFRQRKVPVAQFKDDAPCSLDANRAFRKKHDRCVGGSAPAASGGKLRNARIGQLSHASPHVPRHAKRPRRRPARLDISEVERIELRPENVALVAQRLDRSAPARRASRRDRTHTGSQTPRLPAPPSAAPQSSRAPIASHG